MIEMQNYQIDESRRQTLATAVATYGEDTQLKIAIEEMSELTKAICKHFRAGSDPAQKRAARASIIEEAADVQIMLDQIRIMFGDTAEAEEKKLARLRRRLGLYDMPRVYIHKSVATACADAVSRAMQGADSSDSLDQSRERAVAAVNNLFNTLGKLKGELNQP